MAGLEIYNTFDLRIVCYILFFYTHKIISCQPYNYRGGKRGLYSVFAKPYFGTNTIEVNIVYIA